MSIITISRGSYSSGKEIAQKVAQRLGYDCISREALLKNSREFNIPEIKLIHAFEEGPSVLDRFTFGKEKYIAYIQAALLNHLRKNNIVYHGFAFHFFVKEIPEVLKVRIIDGDVIRMSRVPLRSFIMYKPGRVLILHPSGHGSMVWTCARFIAEGPEYN